MVSKTISRRSNRLTPAILISYIVAWFTKDERVKSPVRLLTQLGGVLIIFGAICFHVCKVYVQDERGKGTVRHDDAEINIHKRLPPNMGL